LPESEILVALPRSLRLDADVLDWLRNKHARYQPEINRILREKMEADT
jgi:uncharacterized protein (DUF4415 family)